MLCLAPTAQTWAQAQGAAAAGRIDVLNNRGEVRPLAGTTVESETLDEVRYTRAGSDRTESQQTKVVVHIEYGKGTPGYEGGLAALAQGDLLNAVNLLKAAADAKDANPPWAAAHARLALAEALAQKGDTADARAALAQFRSDYPEHRLTPRALLLSARYASAAGEASVAAADIQQVQSLVSSGKVTPDWGVRAHLEHGQNLLDAGDHADARTAFQAAQAAAQRGRDIVEDRPDLGPVLDSLVLEARSGVGSAMLASGDLAGARSFFDALMNDGASDPAIRAAALNGKAEADFLDRNRLKDAQLGFARVAVIGAGVPNEHAKALYYLGQCCEALGEAGQEANGRARAQQYYKDVEKRYPGTRWARLARESLP